MERIRNRIDKDGLSTLEVDGGVKVENANRFTSAVHVLVSGSGVFKSQNRIETITKLQQS